MTHHMMVMDMTTRTISAPSDAWHTDTPPAGNHSVNGALLPASKSREPPSTFRSSSIRIALLTKVSAEKAQSVRELLHPDPIDSSGEEALKFSISNVRPRTTTRWHIASRCGPCGWSTHSGSETEEYSNGASHWIVDGVFTRELPGIVSMTRSLFN